MVGKISAICDKANEQKLIICRNLVCFRTTLTLRFTKVTKNTNLNFLRSEAGRVSDSIGLNFLYGQSRK